MSLNSTVYSTRSICLGMHREDGILTTLCGVMHREKGVLSPKGGMQQRQIKLKL